jgi:hypothetical protein
MMGLRGVFVARGVLFLVVLCLVCGADLPSNLANCSAFLFGIINSIYQLDVYHCFFYLANGRRLADVSFGFPNQTRIDRVGWRVDSIVSCY